MAKRAVITAAQARAILDYNPETGGFRWKARTPEMFPPGGRSADWQCRNWNSRWAGQPAGTLHPGGHVIIRVFGKNYKAHRLAWLLMTGEWPKEEIDHKNLAGSDNRWANLREATHHQNMANKHAQRNNTSGFKGVVRHKDKWRAKLCVNGRHIHVGIFDTGEEAAEAYFAAASKHMGEYARGSLGPNGLLHKPPIQ
jgi:hypothetical protein